MVATRARDLGKTPSGDYRCVRIPLGRLFGQSTRSHMVPGLADTRVSDKRNLFAELPDPPFGLHRLRSLGRKRVVVANVSPRATKSEQAFEDLTATLCRRETALLALEPCGLLRSPIARVVATSVMGPAPPCKIGEAQISAWRRR